MTVYGNKTRTPATVYETVDAWRLWLVDAYEDDPITLHSPINYQYVADPPSRTMHATCGKFVDRWALLRGVVQVRDGCGQPPGGGVNCWCGIYAVRNVADIAMRMYYYNRALQRGLPLDPHASKRAPTREGMFAVATAVILRNAVDHDDAPPIGAKFSEPTLRAAACEITRAFVVHPTGTRSGRRPPLQRITDAYGIEAIDGYPPATEQDWATAPVWLRDRMRNGHRDLGTGLTHVGPEVVRECELTARRLDGPRTVGASCWRTCP